MAETKGTPISTEEAVALMDKIEEELRSLDLPITEEGLQRARAKARAKIGPRPQEVVAADEVMLTLGKELKALMVQLESKLAEKEALYKKREYFLLSDIDVQIDDMEAKVESLKQSRFESLKVIKAYNRSVMERFDLPGCYNRLKARIDKACDSNKSMLDYIDNFTPTPLYDKKFDDFA